MHKKLETELMSLAHSILQLKNKEDVNILHKKATEIYEKLSLLKFVNYYFDTTPTAKENKKEIIEKITRVWVKNEKDELTPTSEEKEEEIFEEQAQMTLFEEEKEEETPYIAKNETQIIVKEESNDNVESLELQEIEDTSKASTTLKEKPTVPEEINVESAKIKELEEISLHEKSILNNTLNEDKPKLETKKIIKITLNDRIAIVKNLFENSQSDFNRVLSQINSFDTEKETKNFINRMVKPDYNWTNHKETEDKLIQYIEQKFK